MKIDKLRLVAGRRYKQVGVIVHGDGLNVKVAENDAAKEGYAMKRFSGHTRLYKPVS